MLVHCVFVDTDVCVPPPPERVFAYHLTDVDMQHVKAYWQHLVKVQQERKEFEFKGNRCAYAAGMMSFVHVKPS